MFRATDDELDEASVEQLLEDRTAAKQSKNYKKADEIAQKLQGMGIAYVDEKKLWYTKKEKGPAPKKVASKKGGKGNKKKRSSSRSNQEDRKRTRKKW